jgi:spermidine synthase
MASRFEELDWQQTPYGAISLRRRFDPYLQAEVYEAKLDDEFLMSSVFTHGETELARLALDLATPDKPLDVVVGGLGLGYTTRAVLTDPRVRQVITVEAHAPVISWHQRQLIPDTTEVTRDRRSRLVHGDFFTLADDPAGFDPDRPCRRFDAILLDIDHSPRHLLHPSHAGMYTLEGLHRLAAHLRPSGLFGLWSNDPPDQRFQQILSGAFATCHANVVRFDNPLQDRPATNTVYLATKRATL